MGKLCKDQLVGRLVALFKETDQSHIDDAVAQAKGQLTTEAKQAKRTDLEKLFDSQIETLKDRGVPEQIIEALQNQKSAVVKKASDLPAGRQGCDGEGNIPFFPVIKPAYLGYYGLMSMVRNGSKVDLNLTAITDQVATPYGLYYIYDIEDGNSTCDKSPEATEKIFEQQKRSPLTAVEVVNLCVVTDVLSRHHVWATGSRYESAVKVPFVYLGGDGRSGLFWSGVNDSNSRWGSPSCGSR
jgi:hypothetical protein